jgi:predicted nuclease of restriction endonuclease-like (RecB) superfamily
LKRQKENTWGSKAIEKLAQDLQNEFPGISGFSYRNIFRMQAFFLAYELLPQPVAVIEDLPVFAIPWGHNALLLEKIKNFNERLWYEEKVIEDGWSSATLEVQIKKDLYNREGKAVTNFKQTLDFSHGVVAQQVLKDPYVFDFLDLRAEHIE